ncbi:interleukin-7 receptor subunit alpha-like [Pungitius pungitius]|uniref:interleukin-7 receptor subunit alpha-like n=1 Tax=Pungitius pungitius TaxID=134920 RepID=UPI002E135610
MLRCWTAALLLLLMAAGTRPHSGGGPGDEEPTISCTSHILTNGSSLSCRLAGGPVEDDEDEGGDGVCNMTVCFFDFHLNKEKCLKAFGDTVSSEKLKPLHQLTVTVHLKRGGRVTTMVDLKKIVQPRSPQVKDVTFEEDSHQVVIRLQTPYVKEYLKVLFQLHIWSSGSSTTQNVSSDSLRMDVKLLRPNAEYHVRARAVPTNGWQGSWSEWSETFSFFSPAEETSQKETNGLIVCLVILVVVPSSVVLFCRNRIFTYMWPRIPHPKDTLVHICKTNKGLLLNFKPEEISALNVEKTEKSWEEAEPPKAAESSPSCSTQSYDGCMSTTSVSTEELELSTLLSRSSLDGEESLQSASPSPVQDLQPGDRPPSCSDGVKEAEAYVTMSSFYQIK